MKKIFIISFLSFSFSFSNNNIYLKNGKYYVTKTNKLYSGKLINSDINNEKLESIFENGVLIEKKWYLKNGTIKKILKFDENSPVIEENYFDDGDLAERKLIEDGEETIIFSYITKKQNYLPGGEIVKEIKDNGDVDFYQTLLLVGDNIYSLNYYDNIMEERKTGFFQSSEKKYVNGILTYKKETKIDKNKKIETTSALDDNYILKVNYEDNYISYFINGNKSSEKIEFKDEHGIEHKEERKFDESGRLIFEEIYLNNVLKKEFKSKDYDLYTSKVSEGNIPYIVKYPNGKTAYEKIVEKDKIIEKYFTDKGILIFWREDYNELYSHSVNNNKINYIREKLENLKRYSFDGKLIYEASFEKNKKFIKFSKISYYDNGQIHYSNISKIDNNTKKMNYEIKRYNKKGILEKSDET